MKNLNEVQIFADGSVREGLDNSLAIRQEA